MAVNIVKNGIDLGIVTTNATAMLRFYRDVLGLKHEGTIDMPGGGAMHRLVAGESIIKIVDLDPAPPAQGVPGGIRAATGFRYWTMTVSNLEEMTQTCKDAGYQVMVPPKNVRPGVTIAIIADPDGNWVELLQNH